MEGRLSIRDLSSLLIKIVLSLTCAGITYFGWLGLFILMTESFGSLVRGILWFAAPVATATGFATGISIHEHATGTRKDNFPSVFAWPLLGCAVGAVAIYWQGPMLIVFGMFAVGTASVVLRELVLRGKDSQDRDR
jgi:hypothetical protein